ncbi:MAG TPA: caspase family protein [Allosphingosinicella sp.]
MRRAVLVAAGTFRDPENFPPLRFPVRDATRLREVLLDPELCFFDEAVLIADGTASEAVRALEGCARASEADDLLLFYYSGHGQLDRDGTLALAMPDSEIDYLSTTSLISEELKRLFRMSRAAQKIMILDCCYSGAASDAQFKGSLNETIKALGHQIAGSFLLTASQRFEPAFESAKAEGGALTSCFVEGIKTGAAAPAEAEAITLTQLASYVRRTVPTLGAQQPQSWDLGGVGELVLARKKSRFDDRWASRARQVVTKYEKTRRVDEDLAEEMREAIRRRKEAAHRSQVELIDRLMTGDIAVTSFGRAWDKTGSRPPPEEPERIAEPPPAPAQIASNPIGIAKSQETGPQRVGGGDREAGRDTRDPSEPAAGKRALEWTVWALAALALLLATIVIFNSTREETSANNTAVYLEDDPLMGYNDVTPVDALNGTDASPGTVSEANSADGNAILDSVGNSVDLGNTTGM